jgi:hypothetical protein
VLVLGNHSYDNFLGMLGRGPGETPRGDGFAVGSDGVPTATNPNGNGQVQRAFRMPSTCQLASRPSQEWKDSHVHYDGAQRRVRRIGQRAGREGLLDPAGPSVHV